MALPSAADQVVIQGFLLDEVTGQGDTGQISSDPVPLAGQNATRPLLLARDSHTFIRTGARSTTPRLADGYWALLALSTNDPDLDAYGGRRITFPDGSTRTIQVPFDATLVTVSAAMAAQVPALTQGAQVRAVWYDQSADFVTPTPPAAYYTASQTDSKLADIIGLIDGDITPPTTQTRYVSPDGNNANDGLAPGRPLATLAQAITSLPGGLGVVELAPGTYTLGAGDSITLDYSKVSLRCPGHAVLQWSAAPTAGFALRLISTAGFSDRHKHWKAALDGVTIRGNTGTPLAGHGIYIGGAGTDEHANNMAHLYNGGVEGFANNITFDLNTWRVLLQNFHSRQGGRALYQPASVPNGNSGECMNFIDCMFEGPCEILATGDWHFFGCSLDNSPFTLDLAVHMWWHGCHIENPNDGSADGQRFAVLNGSSALFVEGSEHIINPAVNGQFRRPAYHVADGNTLGLRFTNCQIPMQPHYVPEIAAGVRAFVSGAGRVTATGTIQNQNFLGYALGAGGNDLRNGAAENGNTDGWVGGGNTGQTFTTVTDNPHSGARCFRMEAGPGTDRTASQRIRVSPRQWVMGSMWRRATKNDPSQNITIQLRWLDVSGNEISSTLYGSSGSETSWNYKPLSDVAPAAAAFCELFIRADGGSNGGVAAARVDFDDVMLSAV